MRTLALFMLICCGITLFLGSFVAGTTMLGVASSSNTYCGYLVAGGAINRYNQIFRYVENCETLKAVTGINLYAQPDFFCYDTQLKECTPTYGGPGRLWLAGTIITTVTAIPAFFIIVLIGIAKSK